MTTTTTKVDTNEPSGIYSKRILIVDDEELIVRTVEATLKVAGFVEIRYETDSRLVIDTIYEYDPDLVLLDIMMPNISGLELLKEIVSKSDLDHVLVMILSSAGQDEKYQALDLGALGFIPKPATEQEIVGAISSAFRITNKFGTR